MIEKTNWGWQFSQFQQKVGEWVEYELGRYKVDLPQSSGWSINSWLETFVNLVFWVLLLLFLAWVFLLLWQEFSPYLYSRLATKMMNSHLYAFRCRSELCDQSLNIRMLTKLTEYQFITSLSLFFSFLRMI